MIARVSVLLRGVANAFNVRAQGARRGGGPVRGGAAEEGPTRIIICCGNSGGGTPHHVRHSLPVRRCVGDAFFHRQSSSPSSSQPSPDAMDGRSIPRPRLTRAPPASTNDTTFDRCSAMLALYTPSIIARRSRSTTPLENGGTTTVSEISRRRVRSFLRDARGDPPRGRRGREPRRAASARRARPGHAALDHRAERHDLPHLLLDPRPRRRAPRFRRTRAAQRPKSRARLGTASCTSASIGAPQAQT